MPLYAWHVWFCVWCDWKPLSTINIEFVHPYYNIANFKIYKEQILSHSHMVNVGKYTIHGSMGLLSTLYELEIYCYVFLSLWSHIGWPVGHPGHARLCTFAHGSEVGTNRQRKPHGCCSSPPKKEAHEQWKNPDWLGYIGDYTTQV